MATSSPNRETVRAYLAEMAMDIYALRSMLGDAIAKFVPLSARVDSRAGV
jgi:hypothetical protein